jgi:CSLREA domain-containing protein
MTAVDALLILRYVVGLPNSLPPQCDPIGPPDYLTVNATNDSDDGHCNSDHCSLREAVAGAQAGDTITFDIPSSRPGYDAAAGVWTIKLTYRWYKVPEGVTIDGTTQTATRGNTNPLGPEIEIDGSSQPDGHYDCFELNGGDVIRGLVINGCGRTAVFVAGSGNIVAGNYIGTDAAGTEARPYAVDSFLRDGVDISGDNNRIGGADPADRNVISGNNGLGVYIFGENSYGNQVIGNLIGTDRTGTIALANKMGMQVNFDAHDNTIGPGNIIAFNGDAGVWVQGAAGGTTGNTITQNSIHSNRYDGIYNVDGGNNELAPPVITSTAGPVTGTACAGCTIEVFSDNEDEGRVYEGTATADGAGNWSLSVTPAGPNVTATATDAAGNTSMFSAALPAP